MLLLVALSCSMLATLTSASNHPLAYNAPLYPAPITYAAPLTHNTVVHTAPLIRTAAAPLLAAVPAPSLIHKYHAQNELGQASYGHSEALQAHDAVQDAAGNKAGSYSYVAPNGQVISASYVADALGFRVTSNALPVAPALVPIAPLDTPEVVAARIAHLKEHAIAKSRARRSVVAAAPLIATAAVPYSVAPVLRDATLTTIVNTPGHAVSYRVD